MSALSVFAAATRWPNRTALVTADGQLTYAELAQQTRPAVAWLQERGFQGGRGAGTPLFVPTSDTNGVRMLHAFMALGVAPLLLHPRWTEHERERVQRRAEAPLLVPSDWHEHPLASLRPFESAPDDERPLAVLFSSGTTADPKGVVLSRRAFVASAESSASALPLQPNDRWLSVLTLAHVGGLSIITRSLLAGSAVVLASPAVAAARVTAARIAELIEEHEVTIVSLVPAQLAQLLELAPPWKLPGRLRALLIGGAACSPSLLKQARDRGWPAITTYGLTETCSQVATQRLGSDELCGVGQPLTGTEVDTHAGSIRVRGPTLFSGYWPNQPAPVDEEGWFDTGDLGERHGTGPLLVLGRKSELIVTGGENVSPLEVEQVLEQHPAVACACVYALPSDLWGEIVAAAIVLRDGATPRDAELSAWTRQRLAAFKCPRVWTRLESLCFTASGKLDRRATADRARSAQMLTLP